MFEINMRCQPLRIFLSIHKRANVHMARGHNTFLARLWFRYDSLPREDAEAACLTY
jgi:hypothetical protein